MQFENVFHPPSTKSPQAHLFQSRLPPPALGQPLLLACPCRVAFSSRAGGVSPGVGLAFKCPRCQGWTGLAWLAGGGGLWSSPSCVSVPYPVLLDSGWDIGTGLDTAMGVALCMGRGVLSLVLPAEFRGPRKLSLGTTRPQPLRAAPTPLLSWKALPGDGPFPLLAHDRGQAPRGPGEGQRFPRPLNHRCVCSRFTGWKWKRTS